VYNLNKNKTKMKKVIAIVAIATSLVACGGNASTEVKTDSTAVAADTTVKADTAVAPVADTTKAVK
jgi:ABC-type glycerol-3-phosphate transport system substrate-binding protein